MALQLIRFEVNGGAHALRLDAVERVIRAVALDPLPGAPAVVRGIFSLGGRIVPVADPRRRLNLPDLEIALEDRIVVARTPSRLLGLLVHGETEVIECGNQALVPAEAVISGIERVEGIVRLDDGLVIIHDLAKFLSLGEDRALGAALDEARTPRRDLAS